MSNSDSISSDDTPSLHERVSKHLQTCSVCQANLQSKPKGLGQTSQLCSDYLAILAEWSDNEGKINNIVNHDEYGNEGDPEYYEKGGKIY